MKVYIAGPYTKGDVVVNVRNAMEAAMAVLDAGHSPFVPHLCHFLHMHSPRPYETWIKYDLVFLPACEALIRLPGESAGADDEVIEARKLGLLVYANVADFLWQHTETR